MAAERQSTLRQRLFAIVAAGIGAVAASVASFAMAVYDAANPEPLRNVAAGEPVDTGRWVVTVHNARRSDVPPTGVKPPDPTTFVMVDVEVENRSADSSYASANLFRLEPAVTGLEQPVVYLARDNGIASPLNPGMPEKLVVAWEWPSDELPPEALQIVLNSQIYKRRDNLYGASGWFDGDAIAAIELPVGNTETEQ